jgi:molybdenum cofactor cytidylyltransferase
MTNAVVVAAIVPAAGGSERMGALKPLLHVGGKPMLLGVVDALLQGGVSRVTLVASPQLRDQLNDLPPAVGVTVNDHAGSEMIDSIRIGLAASETVGAADGCLVCPCDAAGITGADVRRCLEAFAAAPDRIVIAAHAGRRGHPLIFPASLAGAVRSAECDAGLNRLARDRPHLVREVPCDSPGTTANVNTPADYGSISRP